MKLTIYPTKQIVEEVRMDKEEFRKFRNRFGCYDEVLHKYNYHLFEDIGEGRYIVPRYYPFINNRRYSISEITYPSSNDKIEHTLQTIDLQLRAGVDFNSENQRAAFYFLESKTNARKHALMLNLRTGTGKTFLAIKYACFLKYKVLIIADKIDLLRQWMVEIQKFANVDKKNLKLITGAANFDKIIEDPEKYNDVLIFLTTNQTLASCLGSDYSTLTNFQKNLNIGLKIVDEAHKEIKSLFLIDAYNTIPYNLYLTATPARSDSYSDKLLHYVLPFDTSFGLELTAKSYHKVLLIDYKTNPTPELINAIENSKYGFNVIKYSSYVATDGWEYFAKMMEELLRQLYSKKFRKTFIIFKTLDILDKTNSLLQDIFQQQHSIGIFTGKVPKSDRAEQLNKDIVLCTEKIFQTGIDVPDLEVLINTFPMSSKVLTEQIIGRLRRSEHNSLYVDITDSAFVKTLGQLQHRKQVFRKFAKEMFSLKLSKGI